MKPPRCPLFCKRMEQCGISTYDQCLIHHGKDCCGVKCFKVSGTCSHNTCIDPFPLDVTEDEYYRCLDGFQNMPCYTNWKLEDQPYPSKCLEMYL